MKNYKDYEKVNIGCSDMAALILCSPAKLQYLNMGMDGCYQAYLLDEEAEIPSHYEQEFSCSHWLKIYDDEELVLHLKGKEINIYTAGSMGVIIQVIGKRD